MFGGTTRSEPLSPTGGGRVRNLLALALRVFRANRSRGQRQEEPPIYRISQLPETLLQQLLYERVASEWEHYERQIWQTTSFSMTIIGSLLFVSYLNVHHCIGRTIIALVAFIVGFNLRLALVKQRHFAKTRSLALENLERRAYQSGTLPLIVQRVTKQNDLEIQKMYGEYLAPRTWAESQRALDWLSGTVLGFVIAMPVIAVMNLLSFGIHQGYIKVGSAAYTDSGCRLWGWHARW